MDEIIAGIEAVGADDVQRIADDIFTGDLTISAVGNLGRYRPRAAQLRV